MQNINTLLALNNKDTDDSALYLTAKQLADKLGLKSARFQKKSISSKAQKIMDEVKLKHKSDFKLEDWNKYKYYERVDMLQISKKFRDTITRLDYQSIQDIDQFQKDYEGSMRPVIIQNIPSSCFDRDNVWNWESVYKSLKNSKLKVGEDDKGNKIRVKLKYYYEYMMYQKDDRPLYLFESNLEGLNDGQTKKMVKKYEVPWFVRQDAFDLLGDKNRPPHRWFLIGPSRSGTNIHVDPLYTTAWNMNLQGHKLWILMNSGYSKSMVKAKKYHTSQYQIRENHSSTDHPVQVSQDIDDEALVYFHKYYQALKNDEQLDVDMLKFKDEYGIIECIQKPGDMIVVPGGVWHAVLNLDNTMALTQNFCSDVQFSKVWTDMRKNRPKLSCKFLQKLEKHDNSKYQQALFLNQRYLYFVTNNRDRFVMHDEGKQYFQDRKKGVFKRELSFLEDQTELARIQNKQNCGYSFQKQKYSSTSNSGSSSSDSSSSYSDTEHDSDTYKSSSSCNNSTI